MLLILAGITLIYALGEDSIFKEAQDAKDQTQAGIDQEKEDMGDLVNLIKENKGNGYTKIADIVGKKQDKNTIAEDKNGNRITIPGGFKVVPNSPAGTDASEKVEYTYNGDGTPAVQDGIVIEDATGTDTNGNQFVWVPVGDIKNKDGSTTTIKLGRYSDFTVTDGVLPTPAQEASKTNYNTPVAIDTYYFEVSSSFSGGTFGETTYNAASSYDNTKAVNLQEWISTTLDNGGYYLARYEASSNGTRAASKAGESVKSYIDQKTAAEKAKATYPSVSDGNEVKYYSDLVNSYAWDTAIVFIEAFDRSGYAGENLSEAIKETGGNGDQVCNIHDMSGNTLEWTTETSSYDWACTERGGAYDIDDRSARYYTSTRVGLTDSGCAKSFRLVLCVR